MHKLLRITALILALCLTGTALFSCKLFSGSDSGTPAVPDESAYVHLKGMGFSYSPYYSPVQSRYSYDRLSNSQKELYDKLLEVVYSISPEPDEDLGSYPMPRVRVAGRLSEAELRVTVRALTDDNPYIFWYSHSFSHLWHPDENYMEVGIFSEFAPDKLADMISRVDTALNGFYASVPQDMDDYSREKYVHDYVVDTVEYNRTVADMSEDNEQSIRGHSIYGALVDHSCVCEGYGMTMQLLLNGLGVDCVGVTGMSYDSSDDEDEDDAALHMWNAVKLSGDWYYVDATWDDQDDILQRYDYFNLCDELMLTDHTLSVTPGELGDDAIVSGGTEDMNIFIPTCSEMTYNYYVYECPHLVDYDASDVKDGLYAAALNKDEHFFFYIDPEYLDFDSAVNVLFKQSPQYFFDYIRDVNYLLYDYEIDRSNLYYYIDKKLGSVIVELSYY